MQNIKVLTLRQLSAIPLHLCLICLIYSCASVKPAVIEKDIERIVKSSDVFQQYFVGFCLYDPQSNKYLSNINASKFFTPASNVKILTLATYLAQQTDSIPTFLVNPQRKNELLALGDPTFLHPDYPDQPVLDVITEIPDDTLIIYLPDINVTPYGPGWAWDDFSYSFQSERTLLPIYSNGVTYSSIQNSLNTYPNFFSSYTEISEGIKGRASEYNLFYIPSSFTEIDSAKAFIPFKTSNELTKTLLQEELGKTVILQKKTDWVNLLESWSPIYNANTAYTSSLMMLRSDNFLAEQMLINAMILGGKSSIETFINHTKNSHFPTVSDELIWKDGSGLSRYNMVTPYSQVKVLEFILEKKSRSDISNLFPVGGETGTIKNWYKASEPYVIAKTGTLTHNHNLSGYLITKTGKTLIFSFMNNHYPFSSSEVKKEMESLLAAIRDNY